MYMVGLSLLDRLRPFTVLKPKHPTTMYNVIKRYDGTILMTGSEEECMSFEGLDETKHIVLPEEIYDDYIIYLQDAWEGMVMEG